jgi:Caudovirus prohead serine protease
VKRLYAPIEKVEESDDGTIKVWGYASTGTEDEDGETILPEAIKAALPDYLKWGAVREMHQPKAVGTAIEADVQDDGRTWFGAHVVDPVAVKKVQNKVLKGFSVGGRITGRDEVEKTTITGIKLIEVSLVDRPANPECEILITKRSAEAAIEDLAELLKGRAVDPEILIDAALEKDAAKPYGDVDYADPGYQEDKKKRYPIDTEAHIRAAWNYINKDKNQAQYSSAQVASIKRKIIAAWKKKIDKDGPPSADAGEKLAKGLYSVSAFAQALESLAWICQASQSDFYWEGDGSPVPAQMREWMQDGVEIFCDMAEEEANELVDSLREQAGEAIERIMKGQAMDPKLQLAELNKAGAKFSKETKAAMDSHAEHLGKLHKAMKECTSMAKEACDKMDALMPKDGDGADDGDDDDGKKAAKIVADGIAKAAAAPNKADGEKILADAIAEAIKILTKTVTPAATTTPAAADAEAATNLAKLIGDAVGAATADIRKTVEIIARQPVGGLPISNQAAADALRAAGLAMVERGGATEQIAPVVVDGKVDQSATMMKGMLDPSRAKQLLR